LNFLSFVLRSKTPCKRAFLNSNLLEL